MLEETFEPGMMVSLVARRHGVAPNQLSTWRRVVAQRRFERSGQRRRGCTRVGYRGLQNQVRELYRFLGKKPLEAEILEAEILKEALEHATGSNKQLRLPPSPLKDGSEVFTQETSGVSSAGARIKLHFRRRNRNTSHSKDITSAVNISSITSIGLPPRRCAREAGHRRRHLRPQ
jgi:transposase